MAVPHANQPPSNNQPYAGQQPAADKKATPAADKKATPAANNKQQPAAQEGPPKVGNPGLDPSTDPKIVVKTVNPPVTPDQVVGMAEMPAAATLDLPKIENIKIPPVKNKTIQGHLKAIEAKMAATEKLMKDVVKLQKVQILTEKELFERKRELYQNTFEEYLLDKTVDFENPDAMGGGSKKPKLPGGGGFPFFGGGRRRKGRNPGGGGVGPGGLVPPGGGLETEAEKEKDPAKTKPSDQPVDLTGKDKDKEKNKVFNPVDASRILEEMYGEANAEIFEETPEEIPQIIPQTKPIVPPEKKQDPAEIAKEEEAEPTTPMVPEEVPFKVPVLPGIKPAPIYIPDTIRQTGTEATIPVITLPSKYNVTTEEGKSILAGDILEYVENNPGSELDRKLGLGARVDTGHLIIKKEGKIYVHEPLTQEQQLLIGGLNWSNLSSWVPIVPLRGGKKSTTVPGTSLPRVRIKPRNPASNNRVPTGRKPAPVDPPPGSAVPAQPAVKPTPTTDVVPQNSARPPSAASALTRRQQALTHGGGSRGEKQSKVRNGRLPLDSRTNPPDTPQSQAARIQQQKDAADTALQALTGKPPGANVPKLDPVVAKASGGYGDVELYNSESLNYFRGMSSKIMPMADGGLAGWWNKGRNTRVPNENTARWRGPDGLMADDARQITRSNKAFKSGATGMKGWNPFKAFTPDMVKTGPTPAVRQAFERPVRAVGRGINPSSMVNPFALFAELIINELVNPAPTATYDQVTGPNAYYNMPGYKGPMPSQNLENAQGSMMSGKNEQKLDITPLPPDYIKIPSKKKAPSFVGDDSPDIFMRTSPFTRSTHDSDID